MTALGTGCDGWVSSDLHSASEAAGSPEELQQVYKQWSVTYEREMLANDLHSYKSVTHAALDALDGTTGDLRVMDAGCGTGLLGQFFKSQYASNGQSVCRAMMLRMRGFFSGSPPPPPGSHINCTDRS